MSLKFWWEKYQPYVGIISLIGVIEPILGVIAWMNRDNKLVFWIIIGVIILFLLWIIVWCFRFRKVNKYVFLTWQLNKFAKQEKLWAEYMRDAFSKMYDYQSKMEKKHKEREDIWMELLGNGGKIGKAKKRQKIANRLLESAEETHEMALKRRIRVLIWLINYDQLDIDNNPYRDIRDKYIPHQIILRDDSDIYFRK